MILQKPRNAWRNCVEDIPCVSPARVKKGTVLNSISNFPIRFANDMVYVGLSYYGPALGNNEYLSFFLSSVIEVPSCLLCWFIMDRWGRRWPLMLSMLLSGSSCIVTVLLPEG